MSTGAATVALPGGYWRDGVCYPEAALRPLTGEDEAFLLEAAAELLPAERTTAALGRCLVQLGPPGAVDAGAVRALTVGDREALLLHLRRLTLGDRMLAVLTCPAPECGEKMDLELSAAALLLPPYAPLAPRQELTVAEDDAVYQVVFRLPTGGDQEAAARAARTDPDTAAELLLERCVERITREDGAPVEAPPSVAARVAAAMSELDPQAELRLEGACPACGAAATALYDAGLFFFEELAQRSARLYQEVHLLAYHYHWSEREIMSMTARKRARYLELLDAALAAEGRW